MAPQLYLLERTSNTHPRVCGDRPSSYCSFCESFFILARSVAAFWFGGSSFLIRFPSVRGLWGAMKTAF